MPHLINKIKGPLQPCGTCTACCDVMGVQEIGKPPHVLCPHLGDGCCSIYPVRPASCRSFSCFWAAGLVDGDPRYRPDRLGIMFTLGGVILKDNREVASEAGPYVAAFEVEPGSLETEKARYMLGRIARDLLICLVFRDGRRTFIGPPDRLRHVKSILEEHTDSLTYGAF